MRRDARLKPLPEAQREQVRNWLELEGVDSCLRQLSSVLGLTVSKSTLYEALAYWETQRSMDTMHAQAVAQIEHELDAADLTPEERLEAIDRRFIALAASKNDPELYKDLRYLRIADQTSKNNARIAEMKVAQKDRQIEQKDAEIAIARRKLEILEAKEKSAQEVLGDTNSSPEEKAARMRAIFGVA